MNPERWQKIEELFQLAVARSPEERSAFLQGACGDDESLRKEVETLLASDQSGEALEEIISDAAVGWVAAESKSHVDELVSQSVGRHRILAPLGSGGMGEVYLAQDTTLDRKVAVKLLLRRFTQDRDSLRRFEQEARAVSALNHPNILTIYEVGEWQDSRFIATEYVEGETLRARAAKSIRPLAEVLEIGCQASNALAAAHRAGIIHRDIKPANMMWRSDGYLKVLDFGLAKLLSAPAAGDMTEAGRVIGTINYMSPEQAKGEPLDPRTDVFSLGVVLYEIATGHHPFAGETESATYHRLLHEETPAMQKFVPGLPLEFDQVIRRALEKDRERRYQSAADFGADLKRLAVGTELTQAAKVAASQQRAHRWRVAAFAALLIGVVTVAVFFGLNLTKRNKVALLPNDISPKSIAVLPFANLSEEKANAYFADGIQDEILTRLSKIADLKVISRTSTQHYQSSPDNLPAIARQLGVANILEGSVQKSGNSVRINVQLIKASNDSHLWAETFDRKLTDIFSVESEVAKAIAEQLSAKITGREERVIADKPTDNPDAYDAYLRGLAYTLKPAITPATLLAAQKYLQEAVRLDPKFALAWSLLSFIEARGYRTRALQATPALREETRQAADTALALQPNLGEAILAKGYYYYSCLGDYNNATLYLEEAYNLLPNSSRIPESLAYVARRRGQWDRSLSYFNQAAQLDPRNVSILTQWANTEIMLRRFSDALHKVDQILNIVPDDPDTLVLKAGIAQAQGDLPAAAALLAPLRPGPDDINAFETQVYQAILERRTSIMISRLQEVLAKPNPAIGFYNGELRFWLGWAQEVAGDHNAAAETWRQTQSELNSFLKEQPDNQRLIKDLTLTSIGLGDKAAAESLIARAEKVAPIEKDALDGPQALELAARAAACMGDPDRAVATLQRLLAMPYEGLLAANVPLTTAILRLDPMFEGLQNDPRFRKLLVDGNRSSSYPAGFVQPAKSGVFRAILLGAQSINWINARGVASWQPAGN